MLANKKIYVGKHSKEIQEKAFELGWEWKGMGKEVSYTTEPFLYFNDDKYITYADDFEHFKNHENQEITYEELMEMKVKCELKPFDKVLVRDYDYQEWMPVFFSHFEECDDYPYKIIRVGGYKQCIPFENNEHLLGTTDNP